MDFEQNKYFTFNIAKKWNHSVSISRLVWIIVICIVFCCCLFCSKIQMIYNWSLVIIIYLNRSIQSWQLDNMCSFMWLFRLSMNRSQCVALIWGVMKRIEPANSKVLICVALIESWNEVRVFVYVFLKMNYIHYSLSPSTQT